MLPAESTVETLGYFPRLWLITHVAVADEKSSTYSKDPDPKGAKDITSLPTELTAPLGSKVNKYAAPLLKDVEEVTL